MSPAVQVQTAELKEQSLKANALVLVVLRVISECLIIQQFIFMLCFPYSCSFVRVSCAGTKHTPAHFIPLPRIRDVSRLRQSRDLQHDPLRPIMP